MRRAPKSILVRVALASLFTVASLAATPAEAPDPREDMRMLAQMFAALDARNREAYCAVREGAPYAAYLVRACQSDVEKNLKTPEQCMPTADESRLRQEGQRCLTRRPKEFEQLSKRSAEARARFISQAKENGLDGEALVREERAKLR